MVKKTPGWEFVGSQTFDTKGAANKFAIEQRARKKQAGYNTRYEVDMDPTTGKFRVREFVYVTDEKGRLL